MKKVDNISVAAHRRQTNFRDYIEVVSDLEKGNPGLKLGLLHLPLAPLHLKAGPLVLDNINIA
jgi:hypothetical protein